MSKAWWEQGHSDSLINPYTGRNIILTLHCCRLEQPQQSHPVLCTTSLAWRVLPRYISLCTTQKWLNHFKSHNRVRMPQSIASALLCPSKVPSWDQNTPSAKPAPVPLQLWQCGQGTHCSQFPGHVLWRTSPGTVCVCAFDITFQRGDVSKIFLQQRFGRCWTSSRPSSQNRQDVRAKPALHTWQINSLTLDRRL